MVNIHDAAPQSAKARKIVYFPGLNALRYFAAAAVVVCHVEEFKAVRLLPHHYGAVYGLGTLAVTFFFVLSGFLITYLLLAEKERYQTINVRNFYIRRALRIWPVYYLISILGLFVLPYITALTIPTLSAKVPGQYPTNILLYAFFLPNIALSLKYFVPYASHLWSVGVEEQFYLFWPWIFKYIKKPLAVMVSVIVVFLLLRVGCSYLISHWAAHRRLAYAAYEIVDSTRIECMAVGGIGAYFIHGNQAWFRTYFINPVAEIVSLLVPGVLVVASIKFEHTQQLIFSTFFLLFIINVSCRERSFFRFEGKIWTFLGNVSYSIYMYQYLAIGLVLFLFKQLNSVSFGPVQTVLVHLLSQVVVVIIAYLSYQFLETPFLKLKKKFMVVPSTTTLEAPQDEVPTVHWEPTTTDSIRGAKQAPGLQ